MNILILTQCASNPSVLMLVEALRHVCTQYEVVVWEINKKYTARVSEHTIAYQPRNQLELNVTSESLLLSEIVLVIKRTWSPIREEVLKICMRLEEAGIEVLCGCEAIAWCHSKILQYKQLESLNVIPKSICYESSMIKTLQQSDEHEVISLVQNATVTLGFPLVFKLAKGCRADGIYLIHDLFSLQWLIIHLIDKFYDRIKDGFVLQKFIYTNDDIRISNYYRINMINGVAQSAVQFQYRWEQAKNVIDGILSTHDFSEALQMPVNLNLFDPVELRKILENYPYKNGVMGIDVIKDGEKLYILEFNSGPSISLIVELGNIALDTEASEKCKDFPLAIARFCLNRILSKNNQKSNVGVTSECFIR